MTPTLKKEIYKVISIVQPGIDDKDTPDSRGWTPLLSACLEGNANWVKDFLRMGYDKDTVGQHGWTPLIAAITEGHDEVVKILLHAGAGINNTGGNFYNPMVFAKAYSRYKIINILKFSYKTPAYILLLTMENPKFPTSLLKGFPGIMMFIINQTLPEEMQGKFVLP